LIFCALTALSTTAYAKASIDLSKGKSSVRFEAIGKPSFLKIKGVDDGGQGLSGSMSREGVSVAGKAVFRLDALSTGLELRDSHMKEKYLEIAKFPTAELVIRKLPWGPRDAGDFAEVKGTFAGELTLHGMTKEVLGEATVERDGGELEATVSFTIKLTDFQIGIPSFQGITVADEVVVAVTLEAPVSDS
jgi:polyisoprenoid-binding protein YceI